MKKIKIKKLTTEIINQADNILYINTVNDVNLIFGYTIYRMSSVHIKLFGFYSFRMNNVKYLIVSKND